MRSTFIRTLSELAERDPRILLLTGDLGYTVVEPFAERFPDRFLNVGVAEQNMVGLATGLADAGFLPFLYSIATFASLRAYEIIRNGPIFHQLPVRIVGVGGGFEYGPAGRSHHALEDVGVMRIQPGMRVIAPADHEQARTALVATWDAGGPAYYRLGKDERATVPGLAGRFEPGRAQWVRDGRDVLLIAMGGVAVDAVAAADALAARGVECGALVVASIAPAPVEDLAGALGRFRLALVIEAHYVVGGVGSLVSEVVAERRLDCRIVRCGVRSPPGGVTGSQAYLNGAHGISSARVVETVLQELPGASVSYRLLSIVLPVHRQADHIAGVVDKYEDRLSTLGLPHETILVANGPPDGSLDACRLLESKHSTVRALDEREPGWGRAVRRGLREAGGDLVCYTNSARTSAADLALLVLYAVANPGVVIKANRKIRESWRRRLGSLLYNLECRALFDLSCWDINGTPKVFPRAYEPLVALTRDDDLIDLEFNVICRRAGYPMLEVPIFSDRRHGGSTTTRYRSAARMYLGAYRLWRARPQ